MLRKYGDKQVQCMLIIILFFYVCRSSKMPGNFGSAYLVMLYFKVFKFANLNEVCCRSDILCMVIMKSDIFLIVNNVDYYR